MYVYLVYLYIRRTMPMLWELDFCYDNHSHRSGVLITTRSPTYCVVLISRYSIKCSLYYLSKKLLLLLPECVYASRLLSPVLYPENGVHEESEPWFYL